MIETAHAAHGIGVMFLTWLSNTDRQWFFAVAIGFGFCLSSLECERYTAFWSFGSRSTEELMLIVLITAIVLFLMARHPFGKSGNPHQNTPLVIGIALLQSAGVCGKIADLLDIPMFGFVGAASRILMQSAGILFVLYGGFFLTIGIRKFIIAFAIASLISGFVQISVIALPSAAAYACFVALAPISAIMLVVANKRYGENLRMVEREDIGAETGKMAALEEGSSPFVFCVSIFLLLVLIMALSH